MAIRPVFVPSVDPPYVTTQPVSFDWSEDKRQGVLNLHRSAAEAGLAPLLEISTKSNEPLGVRMSAFNLPIHVDGVGRVPLECAYQSSKVFQRGGPYTDLLHVRAVDAKQDPRLKSSGALVGFRFQSRDWPLVPPTAFYDWLYLSALHPHQEALGGILQRAKGFTDIEFVPWKSVNCQARSAALFMGLLSQGLLDTWMASPNMFLRG